MSLWAMIGCPAPCKWRDEEWRRAPDMNKDTVRFDETSFKRNLGQEARACPDAKVPPHVPYAEKIQHQVHHSSPQFCCVPARPSSPARCKRSDDIASNSQNAGQQKEHLTDISLEYSYADLSRATSDFDKGNLLGAGAVGSVYSGRLPGGTKVAIKVLQDLGGLEGFEDEVRLLSRFRHPNVVTLFGWGQHERKKYLIYELLTGGDLQVKLKNCLGKDPKPFKYDERLRVALDTACGLSHMVNSTPMAFHRDIKSANILLDIDGSAKIADFGLAGFAKSDHARNLSVKQISGTPGYTCASYIRTGFVTEHSEVYSYGAVLLELLINRPAALQGPQGDLIFPQLQAIQPAAPGAHARLLSKLDPQACWPSPLVDEFADLALACVDMVPERRPSFETIVKSIRRLLHRG